VKTLRPKLAELVQQAQASRFAELPSRRWVEQGLIVTAYLYVNGQMKLYTGKRNLAEIWNSQRRMPLRGVLNYFYFVNDQRGRPLPVCDRRGECHVGASYAQNRERHPRGAGRTAVHRDLRPRWL